MGWRCSYTDGCRMCCKISAVCRPFRVAKKKCVKLCIFTINLSEHSLLCVIMGTYPELYGSFQSHSGNINLYYAILVGSISGTNPGETPTSEILKNRVSIVKNRTVANDIHYDDLDWLMSISVKYCFRRTRGDHVNGSLKWSSRQRVSPLPPSWIII